jgi:predicted membrane channel-forming protein YqfA (hemolysin III family)
MNYATQYPRLWFWYLIANVASVVAFTATDLVQGTTASFGWELLAFAMSVVWLVPLYGYVRQRAVRPRWLWSVFFYVTVIALALGFVGVVVLVREVSFLSTVTVVLALVFVYPYAFAVNQYVNRSPHIWEPDLTPPSSGRPSAAAHVER